MIRYSITNEKSGVVLVSDRHSEACFSAFTYNQKIHNENLKIQYFIPTVYRDKKDKTIIVEWLEIIKSWGFEFEYEDTSTDFYKECIKCTVIKKPEQNIYFISILLSLLRYADEFYYEFLVNFSKAYKTSGQHSFYVFQALHSVCYLSNYNHAFFYLSFENKCPYYNNHFFPIFFSGLLTLKTLKDRIAEEWKTINKIPKRWLNGAFVYDTGLFGKEDFSVSKNYQKLFDDIQKLWNNDKDIDAIIDILKIPNLSYSTS
jgi:hypothetical protein